MADMQQKTPYVQSEKQKAYLNPVDFPPELEPHIVDVHKWLMRWMMWATENNYVMNLITRMSQQTSDVKKRHELSARARLNALGSPAQQDMMTAFKRAQLEEALRNLNNGRDTVAIDVSDSARKKMRTEEEGSQ
jgi:hypothetical protein